MRCSLCSSALFLFTGDIISSACEVQSMSLNPAANKEKQMSEVKHLLVQKQRALAELFKSLAATGEMWWEPFVFLLESLILKNKQSFSPSPPICEHMALTESIHQEVGWIMWLCVYIHMQVATNSGSLCSFCLQRLMNVNLSSGPMPQYVYVEPWIYWTLHTSWNQYPKLGGLVQSQFLLKTGSLHPTHDCAGEMVVWPSCTWKHPAVTPWIMLLLLQS